jgi:ABC-type lipoprotein export system ATPase subunit
VSVAVETRDLFRIYATAEGNAVALQGLTLSVRAGELVVVFGPSGSGKTTLLRILAGLDKPSAGWVHVFGTDLRKIRGRSLRDYRSRMLGYVDQHYTRALAPELAARDLVALQLGLLGEPRRSRLHAADELLERVGLAGRKHARPPELSGGEQQRVALCAALAHRPRLVIADEPTGELDSENARRVYALIGELSREAGATTVIVSHDPESASVADRVVHVRDGRVSAQTAADGGYGEEIVVGRGGWLRLPEEFLRRSRIEARATARLDGEQIVIAAPHDAEVPAPGPDDFGWESPDRPRGAVVAEVRELGKTYGAAQVFDGLSAQFEAGKLAVVSGPSGSGKTTLLHLLAGIDLPTAGEAIVLGKRISALDLAGRAELRRESIAVVTQGADLIPFLTTRENVELILALRGVDRNGARDRASDALASVGLGELADQRVARLSTGERQRVAVARAIAARPALLLADEPTARVDEANGRTIAALFARLAAQTGTAIVCATHDPVLTEQADEELALAEREP